MATPGPDGSPFLVGEPMPSGVSAPAPWAREIESRPGEDLSPLPPLGWFLSALSRQLTMPMNRMMSTARLLQAEPSPDHQRAATTICEAGEALLRLLTDALDYARPDGEESKPAAIAFDLRLLVDETITWLRIRAGEKDVTVGSRVHHEVPSCLVGDAGRLRQVLWNLGAHAIDVLPGGGAVLQVGRLQENTDSVTLRFDWRWYRTTEIGAAPELQPTRPIQRGLGEKHGPADPCVQFLIARRLAKLIGGAIIPQDEPGSRSGVTLDLTFRKQPERSQEGIPAASREGLAGARVLVLDPWGATRRSTLAMLEAWGCRTFEATSVSDARALLSSASEAGDPFRFVFVDRELAFAGEGQGAGWKEEGSVGGPYFVALAAVGDRGDLDRARSSGFSGYLPVPIRSQDLADALIEIERITAAVPIGQKRPLVTRHWLAELRRSRTRILIVEDDVVSALVTDWTLRRIGYQVVRVKTAAEVRALPLEELVSFALVIVALRLPDAAGLSLAGELRASVYEGGKAAILAIGYESTRAERDRCHAAGVDAYIASPVDLAHLCELVQKLARTDWVDGAKREDVTARSLTVRERSHALGMVSFCFPVTPAPGGPSAEPGTAVAPPSSEPVRAPAIDDTSVLVVQQVEPEPALEHVPAGEPMPRDASDAAEPGNAGAKGAPPTAETRPVLDVERLNRISMDNAAVRSHLLSTFVKRMRTGLLTLSRSIGSENSEHGRAEIERMAQLSEMLGAITCAELMASLRRLAQTHSLTDLSPLVSALSVEVDRFERVASPMGSPRADGAPAAA